MKLHKNDLVQVMMGKDKGKTGKVERVLPTAGKVVVEGVNQFKRHLKARVSGQKSEVVVITKALPVSNVALVCPSCKKTTRIGYSVDKKGGKVRVCRKCEKEIKTA